MDIKLPLQTSLSSLLKATSSRTEELSFQLHQRVEAKVLDTQITQNRIMLAIADKTLTVQSQEPLELTKGQKLELQVSRLLPNPVFTLQPRPSRTDNQSPSSASHSAAPSPQTLTVVKTNTVKPPEITPFRLDKLIQGQVLIATVVLIKEGKVSLQLNEAPTRSTNTSNPVPANVIITLDSKQLTFDQASLLGREAFRTPPPSAPDTALNLKADQGTMTDITTEASATSPRPTMHTTSAVVMLKPGMLIALKAVEVETGKPPLYTIAIDDAIHSPATKLANIALTPPEQTDIKDIKSASLAPKFIASPAQIADNSTGKTTKSESAVEMPIERPSPLTLTQAPSSLPTLKAGMSIGLQAMKVEPGQPALYAVVSDDIHASSPQTNFPGAAVKTLDWARVIAVKPDQVSLQIVDSPKQTAKTNPNEILKNQSTPNIPLEGAATSKPASPLPLLPTLKPGMLVGLQKQDTEPGKPALYAVAIADNQTSAIQTKLPAGALKTAELARVIDVTAGGISLQLIDNPDRVANTTTSTAASNRPILQLDLKQLIPMPATMESTKTSSLLPTRDTFPLKPGMQISLQLIEPGTTPRFSVSLSPVDERETIVEAQKRLLPLQTSSLPLLGVLQHWKEHPVADDKVADTLHRLANAILQSLPDSTRLTEPSQLKHSIAQSGVFLESTLTELLKGQLNTIPHEDLKLKLSQLLDDLRQQVTQASQQHSPPELLEALKDGLKKTESALARITLNQLNSLPQDDAPKQTWIMELPFVDHNQLQQLEIAIEQDHQARDHDTGKSWGVSITLTPPDLGTIHCKISCYDGSINTRFWSESAATVDKIASHLDHLQRQLESKGLTTGFMDAHQGKPSSNDTSKKNLTQLLNVKA